MWGEGGWLYSDCSTYLSSTGTEPANCNCAWQILGQNINVQREPKAGPNKPNKIVENIGCPCIGPMISDDQCPSFIIFTNVPIVLKQPNVKQFVFLLHSAGLAG